MKKLHQKLSFLFLVLFFWLSASSQNTFNIDISYYGDDCAPKYINFLNYCTFTDTTGPVTYEWDMDGMIFSTKYQPDSIELGIGWHNINLNVFDNGAWIGDAYREVEFFGFSGEFFPSDGDEFCPGEEINFNLYDQNIYVSWDFGDGSNNEEGAWVQHAYTGQGTFDVYLYMETESCGSFDKTQSIVITETAIPVFEAQPEGGDFFCPNDEVFFSINNPVPSTQYKWFFPDGTQREGDRVSKSFPNIGSRQIVVEAWNICGNVGYDTLYVHIDSDVMPYADFYFYPNPVCPGNIVTFEANASGSFYWNFGDGTSSTKQKPNHIYLTEDIFDVQLIVTNGCGFSDTAIQTADVYKTYESVPYAEIYFEDHDSNVETIEVCPGTEVWFQNSSYGDGEGDLLFEWYVDGMIVGTERNLSYIFDTTEYYSFEVSLKAYNNCGGESWDYLWVTVDPFILPVVQLGTFPTIPDICPGDKVLFYDDFGEYDLGYTYGIDYGDGSPIEYTDVPTNMEVGVTFEHIYADENTYFAKFWVTNECGNADTLFSTINVVNDAGLEREVMATNSTLDFNASPMGGDPWMGQVWEFSLAPDSNAYLVFNDNDKYSLFTAQHVLDYDNIYMLSKGTFSYDQDSIYFNDNGEACQSLGSYGYLYQNPESTELYFMLGSDTCSARFDVLNEVTYYQLDMEPELLYLERTEAIDSVLFVHLNTMGPYSFQIGYMENHLDPNPVIISQGRYYMDGIFIVFQDNMGCMDTVDYEMTDVGGGQYMFYDMMDMCMVRSSILNGGSFYEYAPYGFLFQSNQLPPGNPFDGLLSFIKLDYQGPNTYQIGTLNDEDDTNPIIYDEGMYDYISGVPDTLIFYPNGFFNCPEADTAIYTYITGPSSSYLVFSPEATFCAEQETLLITDTLWQIKEKSHFDYGNGNGDGDYSGCPGDNVKFNAFGGVSYEWTFFDGGNSTEQYPVYVYDTLGEYWEQVIITNGCNRADTLYTQVLINNTNIPDPWWYFEAGNYIATGDSIHFYYEDPYLDNGSLIFHWYFGDGVESFERDPIHAYGGEGQYEVTLEVTNGCGTNSQTNWIYVSGEYMGECNPFFTFWVDNEFRDVYFEIDNFGSVTNFYWTFGDNSISFDINPVHHYEYPDFYEVCLTVFDSINGCVNTYCADVQVLDSTVAMCKADFEYVIGEDMQVYFANLSQGDFSEVFWSFGDGKYGNEYDELHQYDQEQYYEVCLAVFDSTSDCYDEYCDVVAMVSDTTLGCNADFTYFIDSLTVSFSDASIGDPTEYFWDFGDNRYAYTANPKHTYAYPDYYGVYLSIYDSVSYCWDDYFRIVPVVDTSINVCNANFGFALDGLTINLSNESEGDITEFFWSFGDNKFSTLENPDHTYGWSDYFEICLSIYDSASGCMDDYCEVVYVVDTSNVGSSCNSNFSTQVNGLTVNFTNKSDGEITDYFWDFGDGKFAYVSDTSHTYTNAGYYEVCLTVYDEISNCMDDYCKVISLDDSVSVSCKADFKTFIAGNKVTLTNKSLGNVTDYFWDFGDGKYAFVSDTSHSYSEPGFYEVCLTVYDEISGCLDEYCKIIIISEEGEAVCNADFNFYVEENIVSFNNKSEGDITDYFWSFGDGKYAYVEDTSHTYTEPGYYEVCLTVYDETSDCMDEYCDIVIVTSEGEAVCNAKFGFIVEDNIVSFNNKSEGDITDYFWSFGDGKYAYVEDTSHTYTNPGYYEVCLTVYDESSDCMDEYCDIVIVTSEGEAVCNAKFDHYTEGNKVSFNNKSEGDITDYFWSYGDGYYDYKEDTSHIYTESGYYEVCLTVYDEESGCLDEFCKVVIVTFEGEAVCNAKFDFYTEGNKVSFNNKSEGDITDYFWSFGDGYYDYKEDTSHIYTKSGYYEVCLTVYDEESGCLDEFCKVVIVTSEGEAICNAKFDYYTEADKVSFNNKSEGDITDYFWSFGDGYYAYVEDTSHIYSNPGYYEVCLTVYDEETGCLDEYCKVVIVTFEGEAICKSKFDFYTEGNSVSFENNSEGNITDYFWSFGDGYYAYVADTAHLYANPGYYEVCLTVYDEESGCMDEYCDVVIVTSEGQSVCKAKYEYYTEGYKISFENLSEGSITEYFWDFDDGTYAFVSDTSHTYSEPGYYEVCLTVYDSDGDCLDDYCKVVVVVDPDNEICNARFESYTEGYTANFTANAIGGYSMIFWDFDDGYNSNVENPTHIFNKSGYYEVSLTVIDTSNECFDSRSKVVFIEGETGTESCKAKFTHIPDNAALSVQFNDESFGNPTSWYWDFGDNSVAGTLQDPEYTYATNNYYLVSLTITTASGCQDTYSKVIALGDVSGASFAYFKYFADSITSTGHFRNKSRGNIVAYDWDYGDGYGSEQENPSHTYQTVGYYAVCLTTESATGEFKTYCNDVRIGNALENPCLFSCVWPGDANNDLEANHYDIMTIGLNYALTGPKRDSVSTFWTGHFGQDWSTYQLDGTNNKHGDCNGDGVINLTDTLAIDQNFAFSHYYTPDKPENDFQIFVEMDTAYEGKATAGKAKARMARPTKNKPAADIYAFGFEIEVEGGEGLIWNTVRVNYNGEWFGNFGENAYGFSVVDSVKQMIYIAMTRLNYENASGEGDIAEIYFDYKDGYSLFDFSFTVTSSGGIDASGLLLSIGGSFSIDIGDDLEICEGESVTLDAGEGFASYSWSNAGSLTNLLEVTESGKYFVTVTDSLGTTATDSIVVTVYPLPVVDLGADQSICEGESVTLDAGTFISYIWNEGSITQTLNVNLTGTYGVSVTDVNGCINNDEVLVTVNPLPVVDLGSDIYTSDPVTLDAGVGFVSYEWQDGLAVTQTYEVSETGTYWVWVTDINGCENGDTIFVDIDVGIMENTFGSLIQFYPNPNNGLFTLIINSDNEDEININIFNLQGKLVYNNDYKELTVFEDKIDVQFLEVGVYYLNVTKGDDIAILKLFIK